MCVMHVVRACGACVCRAGVVGPDEELATWLHTVVPPHRVLLVANKADGARARKGGGLGARISSCPRALMQERPHPLTQAGASCLTSHSTITH